ncbi:hypothetical protein C2845_PMPSC049111 [Panicum miliaceum]|uniref:Dirigent protein n=1 Tax=Panicum miliaceum TaxID=4540 RepID=A0A3L6PCE7_PANMI|nr:hypothetical protein C2845_PMPSC049111 [Panicum miliaceum]
MQLGSGKADQNWLMCYSISFTDTRLIRFKGSSLKVLGDFAVGGDGLGQDGEWAIVGGTGEFAYANGVVIAKEIGVWRRSDGRTWELRINAFCPCISEVTKMGPWGGYGGTAFDIPEPPRSLQTVTIRCGEVINSTAFSYTDRAGQNRTAGPWGGAGPLTATITLAPSETIKQVLATTGTVGGDTIVTSLTLVSNVMTYGPFGRANDPAFSSQVPDNRTVVGFHARAGASVNAIGVYFG